MPIGPADLALARLQRRQFGAFSRQQAVALGTTVATVDGRVRAGRYRVLRPGVHAELGVPDGWRLRAMAAVLWVGGDVVVARRSAAWVHDLDVGGVPNVDLHLLVGQRCMRDVQGIHIHRTRHLLASHVTMAGPLPVTTIARTVCDLAAGLDATRLRNTVASAVRGGGTDGAQLRACLDGLGPIAGARRLRPLLDELAPLDARCRTPLESAWLGLIRRHGLEPTAMNQSVRDVTGRRRVLDALYLPACLPVELDGGRFHGGVLERADDRRRERDLVLTGELRAPLRFTWSDVHDRPAEVVRQVRAALRTPSRGSDVVPPTTTSRGPGCL